MTLPLINSGKEIDYLKIYYERRPDQVIGDFRIGGINNSKQMVSKTPEWLVIKSLE